MPSVSKTHHRHGGAKYSVKRPPNSSPDTPVGPATAIAPLVTGNVGKVFAQLAVVCGSNTGRVTFSSAFAHIEGQIGKLPGSFVQTSGIIARIAAILSG